VSKPNALVLYGDGINCDAETAFALEVAGFEAHRIHTSEILESPGKLMSAQMLALPGGFTYGDEIASGKVLAIKLKEKLKDVLCTYVERGNLVLGICNGFQVLVQMGILPNSEPTAERSVSLCANSSGKFINRWVKLEPSTSVSPYFAGMGDCHLPIRHGEGRLVVAQTDCAATVSLVKERAVLRYSEDVNGSFDRIAALTNEKGNVLGLMPHPEAFIRWTQHPSWTRPGAPLSGRPAPAHDQPHSGELRVSARNASDLPHGLAILKNAAQLVH
jgi:phosphoribosylformylglycinamidine synthase